MGLHLFESDNSSEGEEQLKINNKYAESYEKWRKKEELRKLQDKYSDDLSDDSLKNTSSSEDEESDEGDEEQIFDEKFLKVYGALKRKDGSIYNKEVKFYQSDEESKDKTDDNGSVKGQIEQKKLRLIDYHCKLIKERKGITEEDEDRKDSFLHSKTYHQELEEIKDELKNALKEDDDQDEDLIKIVKKKVEKPVNPQDLLKQAANVDDDIKFLDTYWNSKELDEREEFLKQYVLGRKYMPSKIEFNNISDEEFAENSESENEKEKMKEEKPKVSETKYHFEEIGSEKIKRYPRNVNSVRDLVFGSFKSIRRLSIKERKRREKKEELQRLRNLKREEIKEKLMKIKQITGNEDILKKVDIDVLVDETDFDPENYDRIMNNLFGKEYYDASNCDSVKPVFEFIEGIDDEDEEIPGEGFLKDGENEVLTKKQSKKDKKLEQSRKKDIGIYEDLAGGVPTRFKYREVQSNNFGLTAEELICATDQELNQWVSLKKACQYASDKEEQDLLRNYSCKRNDIYLKKKIFKSIYSEPRASNLKESESNINKTKKKKKKRRGKNKTKNILNKDIDSTDKILVKSKIDEELHLRNNDINEKNNKSEENFTKNKQFKKNRFRKRKKDKNHLDIDRNRLKAYGLTNREIKRRKLL